MVKVKIKDDADSAYNNLKDAVQRYLDDGNDLDDAISKAIRNDLVETRDVVELGIYYNAIDESRIIDDIYDDLYRELYNDDYDLPKWRFIITDDTTDTVVYESDYDYVDQDEAQEAGTDYIIYDLQYDLNIDDEVWDENNYTIKTKRE